jgi:dephospho-CoA kinase
LGITGGIGMGKSTAATFLRGRGLPVEDTDETSRQLTRPGEPALREIVDRFGAGLLDARGELRRDALAALVFSDPERLRELEAILHPRIREHWQSQAARWRSDGRNVGAVVIPLLFETRAESEFDAVVCLACSEGTQRHRLAARGWSDAEISRRLSRQWTVAEKIAKSEFVVWTDVPEPEHFAQWEEILSHAIA